MFKLELVQIPGYHPYPTIEKDCHPPEIGYMIISENQELSGWNLEGRAIWFLDVTTSVQGYERFSHIKHAGIWLPQRRTYTQVPKEDYCPVIQEKFDTKFHVLPWKITSVEFDYRRPRKS